MTERHSEQYVAMRVVVVTMLNRAPSTDPTKGYSVFPQWHQEQMTDAKENSAIISNRKAPAAASERLFDYAPLPKPHAADAEPSPNSSKTKRRVSRQSESHTAQASDAASPVAVVVSNSISEPVEVPAGVAAPLAPHIAVPRVSIVSASKQRVSGLQQITTALETVCRSAYAVWLVLQSHAYPQVEPTSAAAEVNYRLSSVGRAELSRVTGLDRKTLSSALRELERRHLIALHTPSDAYLCKPEIYRIYDPLAAAEKMRTEDGLTGWRRIGLGCVMY